jgi:hypothetical protein
MIALELLAAGFVLAVFGAHALYPFRLAGGEEPARRAWALAAPALLLAAVTLCVWSLGRRPDEAVAWGLTHPLRGSMPAQLVALALAAALVSDLVVVFAWARLEPLAWRLHGALGALALLAQTLAAELVRIGWGPWRGTAAILAAAALRAPLALAAAELAVGPPRWCTTAAGPALAALALLFPAALRQALASELATLGAAAALLAAARFLPASLRRPAGAAGVLLALLFLARSADLSRVLGSGDELHEFELAP